MVCEPQHFGFIVKTAEHHLGVEGKGKAAQWRLTELEAPLADPKEPTCDYKKWDGTPFNGNQAWRGRGPKPKNRIPDAKQRPGWTRNNVQSWTRNNVHFALEVDAKQRPYRPPRVDAKQRPYLG